MDFESPEFESATPIAAFASEQPAAASIAASPARID
jgi:hypothetical protein